MPSLLDQEPFVLLTPNAAKFIYDCTLLFPTVFLPAFRRAILFVIGFVTANRTRLNSVFATRNIPLLSFIVVADRTRMTAERIFLLCIRKTFATGLAQFGVLLVIRNPFGHDLCKFLLNRLSCQLPCLICPHVETSKMAFHYTIRVSTLRILYSVFKEPQVLEDSNPCPEGWSFRCYRYTKHLFRPKPRAAGHPIKIHIIYWITNRITFYYIT